MRTDTWCVRLTRVNWVGRTYRVYYGVRDGLYIDYTPYRGNAARFDSPEEAHETGEGFVSSGRAISYEVEHIPADPGVRRHIEGTGGAA